MLRGGVIATLADVAAVIAAVAASRSLAMRGATADFSISYLSRVTIALMPRPHASCDPGPKQHVVRVEIASDEPRPVAEALVTVTLA